MAINATWHDELPRRVVGFTAREVAAKRSDLFAVDADIARDGVAGGDDRSVGDH